MRKTALLTFLVLFTLQLNAQNPDTSPTKPFHVEWVNGPYLLLGLEQYKSVYMNGVRLGYETPSGVEIGLEYLNGQQRDKNFVQGTTHSAFVNLGYYFIQNDNSTRFRPYLLAGFGFFEFKDFSSDVLGTSFYLAGGAEMNISPTIKGYIEPRYLNTAPLDLASDNQLGVMWGVRARF